MRAILTLLIALGFAGNAKGAVLVGWDFTGAPGDQAFTAPATAASSISGMNLTRGPGITPSAQPDSINSMGWSQFDFGYSDDYYQFGLTVDAGKAVDITQIRLAHASSHGITWQLRSSLSNYTGILTAFSSSGSVMHTDITFPANGTYSGLSGTVGFRLYGYWAGNANGTARLQNSVYEGMMTINGREIPEPATTGLMGLLGMALLSRRRAGADRGIAPKPKR